MGSQDQPTHLRSYFIPPLGTCYQSPQSHRILTSRKLPIFDSADEQLKINALLKRIDRPCSRYILPIYHVTKRKEEKACGNNEWLVVHSCFLQCTLDQKLQEFDRLGTIMGIDQCWDVLKDLTFSLQSLHNQFLECLAVIAENVMCTKDGYRLVDKEFAFQFDSKRSYFQNASETLQNLPASADQLVKMVAIVRRCLDKPRTKPQLMKQGYIMLQNLLANIQQKKLTLQQLQSILKKELIESEDRKSLCSQQSWEYIGRRVQHRYEGHGKLINHNSTIVHVTLANLAHLIKTQFHIYQGTFRHSKKHGLGSVKFRDGAVFEGQFEEDEIHGIGKFQDREGQRFIGQWQRGKLIN